ncbi:hypothetical protein QR680_014317 [Steinernema hermaphroditum]|uniref:Uncharacterized protein n=1 Tax=Steinernema hermaphroditum TaxID=289476 RepID=A0AA39IB70_9BILA|nr:hypothetical protein QR680_014317 [Steinernema hermaphroditum]
MNVFYVILSLFLLLSSASGLIRQYRGADVSITVTIRTADCSGAGTDSDVASSPGFVDEDGYLVWWIPMKALKGNDEDNLERDTEQFMARPFYIYEQCFRPNFFNFEVYSWALNFMARWKPGNMGVAMYVDGFLKPSIKGEIFTLAMDVCRVPLLLTFLLVSASAFTRLHSDASAILTVTIGTGDCLGAGTNADVSASPGFIDEHGYLVWYVKMKAVKGTADENLERETQQVMTKNLTVHDFKQIEHACTMHSHMEQLRYEECFYANFFNFDTYTWAFNFGADWKPGKMQAKLEIIKPSSQEFVKSVIPERDCLNDWVPASSNGHYPLCKNIKKRAFEIKSTGPPYIHKRYKNCF